MCINVDDLLWDVLRRANLYDTVQLLGTGLDSTVTENGDNWSTGQRQLICLARAMLKNSKIILLDEATASVDFVTDEFIQNAIRKDFADATVITIAHRLNTVADYDKIMVMSFGKVIEYNSPRILLESDSEFSKMVKETGDVNQSVIRSIAFKK
jgi:ABC-type multidrug transport system fused ATPase/permease subunit